MKTLNIKVGQTFSFDFDLFVSNKKNIDMFLSINNDIIVVNCNKTINIHNVFIDTDKTIEEPKDKYYLIYYNKQVKYSSRYGSFDCMIREIELSTEVTDLNEENTRFYRFGESITNVYLDFVLMLKNYFMFKKIEFDYQYGCAIITFEDVSIISLPLKEKSLQINQGYFEFIIYRENNSTELTSGLRFLEDFFNVISLDIDLKSYENIFPY